MKNRLLSLSILLSAIILAGTWVYTTGLKAEQTNQKENNPKAVSSPLTLEDKVLPPEGVVLPVKWGDLGKKMVSAGVIDSRRFEELYINRGELNGELSQLLYGESNDGLKITPENSGLLLNLFWALGLSNKNPILEQGPMTDPRYGGVARFASTGGWTLSAGGVMNHYSKHSFFDLTPEEQELVVRTAENIYRPCCGNSTYFPDCNHGMAMLGLLELMASQGVSEEEMYDFALRVNAYWFPDTYLTIAQYLAARGTDWEDARPKEILGMNYSSIEGYRRILSEITPVERKGGGSCGV